METVFDICRKDDRYDPEAYLFVREALTYTVEHIELPPGSKPRHVSGQELADGFRTYALEQFGPITFAVLDAWGIHRTEDIGAIVFQLVQAGILGKTEDDAESDFANGYDFAEAFQKPFLPAPAETKPPPTPNQNETTPSPETP